MDPIPFNRPYVVGTEFAYIQEAIATGHLSGNGRFARRCADRLCELTGAGRALITPSCTAALEMSALLCGVRPGQEVIMPSFTFVSTANAFVAAGAVPVFVDIREDTLNVDEELVAAAITDRTAAVVVVHYAGVGAAMDELTAIAARHGLTVIEDAAHALYSSYRGRPLGGIGRLATLSFHETKNVHCGEGGALLLNDPELVERAEVLQEKGTNRSRFFRGEVDRYTWVDVGSSYLLSDLAAAFLWAQLEEGERLTARRREIWDRYHEAFAPLERDGLVRRPVVPGDVTHNAHLYHLLLPTAAERTGFLADLRAQGIGAVFHYVPLHSSPAGERHGRIAGSLDVTDDVSARLARLPLWVGMTDGDVQRVIGAVRDALSRVPAPR